MTASLRPVFFVIGIMCAVLSAAMLAPAGVDLAAGETESARAFFLSAWIGLFAGGLLAIANRSKAQAVTPRAALLLTVGSWVALAAIGAVPLRISGRSTDASWFQFPLVVKKA